MDVQVGHPEVYPVQVQGPKAKDVLRDLFGDWVLDMKYYWCDEADLDGIPVVISRTGWTAVVGYEIYLRDPSRGDDLWERILDAGKPYDIRVTPSSDPRRIEAGIFDWGSDFGLETNPFEVTGLERLVEPQEADYIGKDALERIRREGVSRKLVGIEIGGDPVDQPTEHWPVSFEGAPVGHVTDATWSRGWRRTSGTSGSRSPSPPPATTSRSTPTVVTARVSHRSSLSSIPRRRSPPPEHAPRRRPHLRRCSR
jgi:aminomethyltransferase